MTLSKIFVGCLLSVLVLTGVNQAAYAQDNTVYRIVTTDGNVYIGTLVSEDEAKIVFNDNKLGQITIPRESIKSIREVEPDQIKDGEYWFDNPHGTRYLFSTNAIGLRKGEGYYQNTWILFNNVNYGLTNNFSMGAGLVPVFLFGSNATPIWLIPKVSIPLAKDNLHLAAGGMFGGVVGGGESFGLGLAFGAITIGDLNNNFTLGMGFGYGDGEWSDVPLFNFSGMTRLNRTVYLITENYLISVGGETAGFLSAAIRWAPESFAVDFGLFRPYVVGESIGGGFIGVPWLGVTIPFGR
jgi:hypothetical protein